jgi:hypothetical protein
MIETEHFILTAEQYQQFYMEAQELGVNVDRFLMEWMDVDGVTVEHNGEDWVEVDGNA